MACAVSRRRASFDVSAVTPRAADEPPASRSASRTRTALLPGVLEMSPPGYGDQVAGLFLQGEIGVAVAHQQHSAFVQRCRQVGDRRPDGRGRKVVPLQKVEGQDEVVASGNWLEDIDFL